MQSSPGLVEGTPTLTTSYYQGNTNRQEETREQRHRRQQEETRVRAAELQKKYNTGPSTATSRAGSIIRQHPQQQQQGLTSAQEQSTWELQRQAMLAKATVPPMATSAMKTTGIPHPMPTKNAPEPVKSSGLPMPTGSIINKSGSMYTQRRPSETLPVRGGGGIPPIPTSSMDIPASATPRRPSETLPVKSGGGIPMDMRQPAPRNSIKSAIPMPTSMKKIGRPPSPPRAPPDSWQAGLQEHQMDEKDYEFLQKEGYPHGLIQAMTDLKSDFAKTIWIIDNSESMTTRDGTVLADVGTAGEKKFVFKCSRWDELQETVSSHIRLSGALRQPTSFRLLNDPGPALGPQRFGICESAASSVQQEVQKCLDIMTRNYPMGQTPLTQHINSIIDEVTAMRAGLLSSGKRVAIVICTDGVPTDLSRDGFLKRLRELEGLPVWLVIRLCTNEPKVVDFYNQLDSELKISVDVVDDFHGEAIDICKHNPWLNYGLPLHRARERGFNARVLDFLDECPLSGREQKTMCGVLFGEDKMQDCPEPDVDMPKFLNHIETLQEAEKLQWDPIEGKVQPWVNAVGNSKAKLRKMGAMRRKKTSSFVFGCFGM